MNKLCLSFFSRRSHFLAGIPVLVWVALLGFAFNPPTEGELEEGYYIVAGVFSSEDNAKKYVRELKEKGLTIQYAYSKPRNMYYCYFLKSQEPESLEERYTELKKKPEFANVWILQVKNHQETKLAEIPHKETPVQNHTPQKETYVIVGTNTVTSDVKSANNATASNNTGSKTTHHPQKSTGQKSSAGRDMSNTHHTYKVLITIRDEKDREIPATVQILNGPENKVIANVKNSHESHIHIPKKEEQIVQLVCDVFGYHKTELALPLGDPIALSALKNVKLEGEKIAVDLTLQKVHKGDIMIMFNVFFHPNSNIMRMKSEMDLKTLLMIMKDNPSLKIMVHGHTNGNGGGDITKITDNCENFFDPSVTEKTKGSAVKLSELRAEAIKLYLEKNGIEPGRIAIKGWGGKKMIYKEDSPHYQMNARVEVEVLDI